jgi:hypothetical protein
MNRDYDCQGERSRTRQLWAVWRNWLVDSRLFDALVRELAPGPRRGVVLALLGLTMGTMPGLLHFAEIEAGRKNKKRKGQGKKKKNRKRRRICTTGYPLFCSARDNWCCAKGHPVCCSNPFSDSGVSCYESYYHCCPVEFGGGACTFNQTCCPPIKGEIYRKCINPALGYHCCPLNSGGYCSAGSTCCSPERTNGSNFGCCSTGRACCNTDGDCDSSTGQMCSAGCCLSI